MDKNLQVYIDKATTEVLFPTFAVTRQYLDVNEVAFENEKPKVERVDFNYGDNLVAVYFPFKGERYFLQINLTKAPDIRVDFVSKNIDTFAYDPTYSFNAFLFNNCFLFWADSSGIK
jgi:hypothetical protein